MGGKKALRDEIYKRMPAQYTRYVEVFGGAAWVLFGRQPDGLMEVYNDYNSNLTNLFFCVKHRTWEFLRCLGFLPLNSRDEFFAIRRFLDKGEYDDSFLKMELELAQHNLPEAEFEDMELLIKEKTAPSDIRKAAAFYKMLRYSYGNDGKTFGCLPCDIRKFFALISQASRRLGSTIIENQDFETLIRHYDRPGAFLYCDPPYFGAECYAVEFPREDHFRLKKVLGEIQGKWMLSYNDCDFIRDLYQNYYITPVVRLNNLTQRYDAGSEYAELIITSYDPQERALAGPRQLSLFDPELMGGDTNE